MNQASNGPQAYNAIGHIPRFCRQHSKKCQPRSPLTMQPAAVRDVAWAELCPRESRNSRSTIVHKTDTCRKKIGHILPKGRRKNVFGELFWAWVPDLYRTQAELIGKSWPCIRRSGLLRKPFRESEQTSLTGRNRSGGSQVHLYRPNLPEGCIDIPDQCIGFFCYRGMPEKNLGRIN